MTARHRDDERRLGDFAGDVLAVCPSCGACVHVRPVGGPVAESAGEPRRARRAACGGCAWAAESDGGVTSWGAPRDPFLGLPLWLVTTVGDDVLWAFNGAHLDALESYVAAGLRERSVVLGQPMSMLDTLPGWLKSARNRAAVLAGIRRLRERLAAA